MTTKIRRRVFRVAQTSDIAIFKSKSFSRNELQYFPQVRADGYCRCDCESHHYRHKDAWIKPTAETILCIHLKRAIATLEKEKNT